MKMFILFLFFTFSLSFSFSSATNQYLTFGQGLSSQTLYSKETEIFSYLLSDTAANGVMTHFWVTGDTSMDTSIFNYYIDGETVPSITFSPYMIVGAGWVDKTAPWGNKWFGKGAHEGAWYCNFPIPFTKSIRVTGILSYDGVNPAPVGTGRTIYVIVRGSENINAYGGSYVIPGTSRLVLQRILNYQMQPLEYINVVNLSSPASGVIFFHTLAVQSGNLNFLEGCYHLYSPYDAAFPGVILSTGTEDYYDSAYYFDAGEFRQENAGLTHLESNPNTTLWAAYRMHEVDPLFFNNGVRMTWRNGDTNNANGWKCITEKGGTTAGNPTVGNLTSYAWVYTW